MHLYFDPICTPPIRANLIHEGAKAMAGVECAGPSEFLSLFCQELGLNPEAGAAAVRIEQYRGILEDKVNEEPSLFYADSFQADPFSVAKELLAWRDELVWAEWDFSIEEGMPERFRSLAEIEASLRKEGKPHLDKGTADRWVQVKKHLVEKGKTSIRSIYCLMPKEHTPPFFNRLLALLEEKGVELSYRSKEHELVASEESDLGRFQRFLIERDQTKGTPSQVEYRGDGSLILLHGDTEREIAQFLTRLMKENEAYHPVLVRGGGEVDTLSEELSRNGLPGIGEEMDLAGAPVPQLFFLTAQLIWEPLDPARLMEFLTMPRSPIPGKLRYRLAKVLSEKPGRRSEDWEKVVRESLEEEEEKEGEKAREKLEKKIARWLHHELYDEEEGIPVRILKERFEALRGWVRPQIDDEEKEPENPREDSQGLQLLNKVVSGFIELLSKREGGQKIPRTIVEKWADVVYQEEREKWKEAEASSLILCESGEALKEPCKELAWWGFINPSEEGSFRRDWLRKEEETFLEGKKVEKELPEKAMDRRRWAMQASFFAASERALLVIPERVDGALMEPHPFHGDLDSSTKDLFPLTFDIAWMDRTLLPGFETPGFVEYERFQLPRPAYYWKIEKDRIDHREEESYSSLRNLFEHPHQWVLKYQAGVSKASLLRTPDLNSLEGTLAHRFAEELFEEGLGYRDEQEIERRIDERFHSLLAEEGSFFLMGGYRNKREVFKRKLTEAMKTLHRTLKDDGWDVKEMEGRRKGSFNGVRVTATIDMILERNGEEGILDLKRSGNFQKTLEEGKEIQLVLYASTMAEDGELPPSGYFNLERARLVSRYKDRFSASIFHGELQSEEGELVPERILQRMKNTYDRRLKELQSGKVELGYELNAKELNSYSYMDGEECLKLPTEGNKSKPFKKKPFDHEYVNLIQVF